jgi:uncharacterized phiE125 gp8 family phage protein
MAIYINGITVLADASPEPVSLTDAKTWMRITYSEDDTLIQNLLQSARVHIEKLTGLSLVNKLIKTNFDLTGNVPQVWMVDLPYGPLVCVDNVKYKTGINTYETLVKNDEYEVIGGKVWCYTQGNYTVQYQAGYGTLPEDLASDILTLTAWSYENRGKKFEGDARGNLLKAYPNWDGLNFHQYKKVVI